MPILKKTDIWKYEKEKNIFSKYLTINNIYNSFFNINNYLFGFQDYNYNIIFYDCEYYQCNKKK